jgi:hypothetical protein
MRYMLSIGSFALLLLTVFGREARKITQEELARLAGWQKRLIVLFLYVFLGVLGFAAGGIVGFWK